MIGKPRNGFFRFPFVPHVTASDEACVLLSRCKVTTTFWIVQIFSQIIFKSK